MNIEYLRYFLDVARTKSITKAANENFISPQGMSRAMRELERELDCDLLVRYSNRLVLSEQGNSLVPYAKRVVDEYANFNAHALSLGVENECEETRVVQMLCQRISSFTFIPHNVLARFVAPDSLLQYREMENSEIVQLFRRRSAGERGKVAQVGLLAMFDTEHVGAFTEIKRLEESGYVYRPYLRTHDMAMISGSSPLAKKERLNKQDILSYPIVVSSTILHDCIAERFGEENIALTSSEFKAREELVRRDAAISFLPAISKLLFVDDGGLALREFDDSYDVEIGFLGTAEDLRAKPFLELEELLTAFYRAHEAPEIFELVIDRE